MGLDISHGAWHGGYSSFMFFRTEIAKQIGIPLNLMEGFYEETNQTKFFEGRLMDFEISSIKRITDNLPLKWSSLKPNALHYFLNHSDCDGYINWSVCNKIADQLEIILPNFEGKVYGGHIGDMTEKIKILISGLRIAFKNKEKLRFR